MDNDDRKIGSGAAPRRGAGFTLTNLQNVVSRAANAETFLVYLRVMRAARPV